VGKFNQPIEGFYLQNGGAYQLKKTKIWHSQLNLKIFRALRLTDCFIHMS